MKDLSKAVSLALVLAAASAASAQETAAPEAPATEAPAAEAPAEGGTGFATGGFSTGQEVGADGQPVPAQDGPGSVYVASEHGAWQQRCVKTEDGSDPCQLYQLLKDPSGNPVAEISLFGLPQAEGGPTAGATIIAPLETLLTENLIMQVDAGQAKAYPFTFCTREGCVARIGLTSAEVDSFKRGNVAKLTIVPVVAPDQKVTLEVSLTGFTAGYDAVNAANAKQASGGN